MSQKHWEILTSQGPVVQKPISTKIKFLTRGFVSNLTGNDLSCKFGINKFFPRKTWTVFYKNYNLFLREAVATVIFASLRVKFNPEIENTS